ncbi:MAG: RNA methyltransferase [Chloroflexi bacterium]|nr:MAG: RNA methyltransferase [Chloroflexota bacterium]MBL1197000.1 RNA methyltransferase [Chloroflexota bacterium]NOH14295.1 RNA methyltransferase [Chloroflexota bacterium]
MITSTSNPKIQRIKALQKRARVRREEQAFVVEGVRLTEEALQAGCKPQIAFFTEDLNPRGQEQVNQLENQGTPLELVEPHVMQAASDTQAPQGILLVLPLQALPLPEKVTFALILDQLRDPGNLGTILRTALAAGVDAIFLSPGSVDAFSPKVLRAGMGAHFRLPVVKQSWEELGTTIEQTGLQVLLAAAGEGDSYLDADLSKPTALLLGGEARGASEEAAQLTSERIHIPMPGEAESLNAAVAASVLMFEVVRQRG